MRITKSDRQKLEGAIAPEIRKSAFELSAHDACHAQIEFLAYQKRRHADLTPAQSRAAVLKGEGSPLLTLASGPLGHLPLSEALDRLEAQYPDFLAALAAALTGASGRTASTLPYSSPNDMPVLFDGPDGADPDGYLRTNLPTGGRQRPGQPPKRLPGEDYPTYRRRMDAFLNRALAEGSL